MSSGWKNNATLNKRVLVAVTALAALLLVGVSARSVVQDPSGILWGDRVDSVHGAWTHWWRARPGSEGDVTRWVSFPDGERGALLYPLGHIMASPAQALWGPVAAHNLLAVLYLLLTAAFTGLLTARLAGDVRAGMVAVLVVLAARPLVAHVGLGNIEGLGVAWLPLLVWLGLRWERAGVLVGLVAAVSVLENPYCLPVTGVMAGVLAWRRGRRPGGPVQVGLAALAGVAPVLLWLWSGGGVHGGTLLEPKMLQYLGMEVRGFEHTPTVQSLQLVWPWPLVSFRGHTEEVLASGGGVFLGWLALALALVGAAVRRDARLALVLAGVACLLALGSFPWGSDGPPGLFWLVNWLLSCVTTFMSQPIRYTVFAAVALAVAAGLGAAELARRWRRPWILYPSVCALVCVEALLLGGPSLEVPGLLTRQYACLNRVNGPVHTVMFRNIGPRSDIAQWYTLLFQLSHQQPGTHAGIGGWAQQPRALPVTRAMEALDTAVRLKSEHTMVRHLANAGVRWVIGPASMVGTRASFTCGGWAAAPLEEYLPSREHRSRRGHP